MPAFSGPSSSPALRRLDRILHARFRSLVLARILEPTTKLDALRVPDEAGIEAPSYRTVTRRLRVFGQEGWRGRPAAVCAAHARLGPSSLVLFDVSTLYFETDVSDKGTPKRSGMLRARKSWRSWG